MSRRFQWISTLAPLMILTVVAGNEGPNTYTTNTPIMCDEARLRCAYRTGCGAALQQYITSCATDLLGDATSCPETCLLALIALSSTDEGKQLMRCTCPKNDTICIRSKQRVEVCRVSVIGELNKTRVSCKIATIICNADTTCFTALKYYHHNCRSMINGKKCTHRCKNSIDILSRQEKAAKLNTCICDGAEEYDCRGIHRNMNYLCFGKTHRDYHEVHDTRTNEISRISNDIPAAGFSAIAQVHMILGLLLLIVYISQD